MLALALLALSVNRMWFALPLILTISLVYAATRHESLGPILHHALRTAVWITGFMLVVFAILWGITFWLLP